MALTAKQKEGLELLSEARDSNWAHGSSDLGSFASVAVLMKIFQNLLADPENHSNRKLRTSNDKVRALLATAGVQELLIGSGFVEVQYTDGSPSVWTAKTVDRAVVQAGLERNFLAEKVREIAIVLKDNLDPGGGLLHRCLHIDHSEARIPEDPDPNRPRRLDVYCDVEVRTRHVQGDGRYKPLCDRTLNPYEAIRAERRHCKGGIPAVCRSSGDGYC